MSHPTNREELIAWFTDPFIERVNGEREEREPYMTVAQAEKVAGKIGQPGYFRWDRDEPMTAERVWDFALKHGIFMHDLFGWMDRDGVLYGCAHASHEVLLWFLDMDAKQAERAGWVRVSMGYAQTLYRMSEAQVRALTAMNRMIDDSDLPRWRKPKSVDQKTPQE